MRPFQQRGLMFSVPSISWQVQFVLYDLTRTCLCMRFADMVTNHLRLVCFSASSSRISEDKRLIIFGASLVMPDLTWSHLFIQALSRRKHVIAIGDCYRTFATPVQRYAN